VSRARITTYRAHGSNVDGLLRWRVKGGNGEPISKCSEGYHREEDRGNSIVLTYEACLEWIKVYRPEYFMKRDPENEAP
jgi:hypothetical protein